VGERCDDDDAAGFNSALSFTSASPSDACPGQ
jgi:hypothetical protein